MKYIFSGGNSSLHQPDSLYIYIKQGLKVDGIPLVSLQACGRNINWKLKKSINGLSKV